MILKKISPILAMIVTIHSVCAQDWFSSLQRDEKMTGYIIGVAGDTIQGMIQFDYPIVMQKRVTFFQEGQSRNNAVYRPADIRGYSIGEKRWLSLKVKMDTYEGLFLFDRFGIVETIPGPIALVRIFEEKDKVKKNLNSEEAEKLFKKITYNRDPGSLENIYIQKPSEPATAVFTRDFKRSFQDRILGYVGEHTELKEKILSKTWGWKDLEKIVNEYNRWFDSRYSKRR
jgi:hypothetical protein